MDRCARLVTVAPSAPPEDHTGRGGGVSLLAKSSEKMDEQNLILTMVIEAHQEAWGRGGDGKGRGAVYAMFDW